MSSPTAMCKHEAAPHNDRLAQASQLRPCVMGQHLCVPKALLPLLCALGLGITPPLYAQPAEPESNAKAASETVAETDESIPPTHVANWFQSLEKAKEVAAIRRAPILVVAGAEWCAYCKELAHEMERPSVQRELEQWLPVHLDVDDSSRTARKLGISPIPAIRVLTPDGRVVASHDGVVKAIELASWLNSHREIASAEISDHLTSRGRPSGVELIRIIGEFGQRDSTIREAAIARLTAYPEFAASHVVTSFAHGTLAERLSARELLSVWNAPVEHLDPWQSSSLTPERLDQLDVWLAEQEFASDSSSRLTVSQIVEIKRILAMIPVVDPAAAIAMRSQLARFGERAIPFVLDAIDRADDPVGRARLIATRYRIVVSTSLALGWPGGLERLASEDFSERVAATDELSDRASRADEKLLLALFSDANPLIRELALRILKRVSGQRANGALVKLLDDPDSNVRAAVLKELVEDPSSRLVPRIAEYVENERDADLIVHAIRFLRAVNEPRSATALLPLFHHPSWRVRAEAAAGVTKIAEDHDVYPKLPLWEIAKKYIALLEDEDSFVVARAAEGLRVIRYDTAIEPLIAAATQHPEVASEIVEILANDPVYAKSYNFVANSIHHESPVVRAAAIDGLLDGWEEGFETPLEHALADDEQTVRITALTAIAETLASKIKTSSQSLIDSGPPTEELSGDDTKYEWSVRSARKLLDQLDWTASVRRFLDRSPEYDYASLDERIAACCVGALLGDPIAVSRLANDLPNASDPNLVVEILPQLLRTDREQLFLTFASTRIDLSGIEHAADALANIDDPGTAQLYWNFLAQDSRQPAPHRAILTALIDAYFEDGHYNLESVSPKELEQCVADCQRYNSEGTTWQQVASLYLVAFLDREAAIELAEQHLANAQQQSEGVVTLAAANVLLFCISDNQEAKERAVELAGGNNSDLAHLALMFLAWETEGLDPWIVDKSYWVAWHEYDYDNSGPKPIVPKLTVDIDADLLRQAAVSSEPRLAAAAAYLLTLQGEQTFVSTVVNGWQSVPNEDRLRQLAYRAVAIENRSESIAVLKEIYSAITNERYAEQYVPDFYWTIRTMTAPGATKLRRRIRTDFGREALQ